MLRAVEHVRSEDELRSFFEFASGPIVSIKIFKVSSPVGKVSEFRDFPERKKYLRLNSQRNNVQGPSPFRVPKGRATPECGIFRTIAGSSGRGPAFSLIVFSSLQGLSRNKKKQPKKATVERNRTTYTCFGLIGAANRQ